MSEQFWKQNTNTYYEKYAYALAHKMSFDCNLAYFDQKTYTNVAKIDSFLTFELINILVLTMNSNFAFVLLMKKNLKTRILLAKLQKFSVLPISPETAKVQY